MAGALTLRVVGEVTGLDRQDNFHFLGTLSTTPTMSADLVQVQATADTAEAVSLGGITTPQSVTIRAVENDVQLDTSYSTTFHAELSLAEGEVATFTPEGTLYFCNATAEETATIAVVAVGT